MTGSTPPEQHEHPPEQIDHSGCPALAEHNSRQRRRSADRFPASLMRIIMALIGIIGAGSGGYVFRDKVMAAPPAAPTEATDTHARQQIELLKVELRGELGLIRQRQEQTNERLKEILDKAERAERYRRRSEP